jgi:integrase
MAVPKDLQILVGKTELRYSLKTGYLGDAKYKARLLAGQVQRIFKHLREDVQSLSALSDEKIKELIDQFIKDYLAGLETRYFEGELPWNNTSDFNSYVNDLDAIKDDIVGYLGMGDYSSVDNIVAGLLGNNGIEGVEKDSAAYIMLCRGILQSQLKLVPIEKKHMLGDYSYQKELADIFEGQFKNGSPNNDQPAALLSKVINDYAAENKRAENWSERTIPEYKTCAKLMLKVFGDVPINTITFESGRYFKETLTSLPPNILNSKKYKNLSIDEILDSNPKKTLSVKTVNKYLDFASGLFKYAKRHNYTPHNPIEGLRIRLRKRAGDNRAPYSEDDLKTLFHSPEYLEDKHKHSYCFWLPVLALYTGCRLEELCQLHTDDIKKMGDIWVLDINDETQDKRLKTLSSKRIIPLHPHLTDDLCFPKFVDKLRQAGEQRIFPDLNKIKDRYGHAVSRWFGRYKKRLGIVPDEKGRAKDFHSFRKTFTTKLRHSGIDLHMIKELDGHSIKDITADTYSDRFPAKVLLEGAILKLDYGVDLGHLKKSKFVPS